MSKVSPPHVPTTPPSSATQTLSTNKGPTNVVRGPWKPQVVPKTQVVPLPKTPLRGLNGGRMATPLVQGLKPGPLTQVGNFVRNIGPGALMVGAKVLAFLSPLLLGGSEARQPGFSAFALGTGGYQGDPDDHRKVQAWKSEMQRAFDSLTDAQRALFAEVEEDTFVRLREGHLKPGSLTPVFEEAYSEILGRPSGDPQSKAPPPPAEPLTRDRDHDSLRPATPPELPTGPAPKPLDLGEHVSRPAREDSPLKPDEALVWTTPPGREGFTTKPQELEISPQNPAEIERRPGSHVDLTQSESTVAHPSGTDANVKQSNEINLAPSTPSDPTFRSTDIVGATQEKLLGDIKKQRASTADRRFGGRSVDWYRMRLGDSLEKILGELGESDSMVELGPGSSPDFIKWYFEKFKGEAKVHAVGLEAPTDRAHKRLQKKAHDLGREYTYHQRDLLKLTPEDLGGKQKLVIEVDGPIAAYEPDFSRALFRALSLLEEGGVFYGSWQTGVRSFVDADGKPAFETYLNMIEGVEVIPVPSKISVIHPFALRKTGPVKVPKTLLNPDAKGQTRLETFKPGHPPSTKYIVDPATTEFHVEGAED